MMVILPKKFAKLPEVQEYVRKKSLFETIVSYVIDWRFRNKKRNLVKWLNEVIDDELLIKVGWIAEQFKKYKTNDEKIIRILRWANKNLNYIGDDKKWNVDEYWQSPQETIELYTGDCEDGAILIYALAHLAGIPDNQLRIVAGSVVDGGHCYVVYLSDSNAMEYAIDWCYYYNDRYIKDGRPFYVTLSKYFNGTKEWFSFNRKKAYNSR